MHRYLIFAAAGLSLFMYAIDSTAVAVAFPNFIQDFGTNVLWAAWTMSIYMLAVTSTMPLMGSLSDSFGRKRVYVISLALFTTTIGALVLLPVLLYYKARREIRKAAAVPERAIAG